MTAYAMARLSDVRMGTSIKAYLAGIDDTLAAYDGHFVIHGGRKTVLEGSWFEYVIVIAFPDLAKARGWYDSPVVSANPCAAHRQFIWRCHPDRRSGPQS